MANVARGSTGAGAAPERKGAWRDAFLSLGIAMWFPFAVALLPVVGSAIGLTGYGGLLDVVRAVFMAVGFFLPFVVGVVLGWRGARGGLHGVSLAAAWVGLVANVAVVLVSLSFLLGEFTNPH